MNKELIPEIHDLFKMTRLGHQCDKWTNSEHKIFKEHLPSNSPTWKGIIGHHLSDDFEIYPTDSETFLLCIADNLASSLSREKTPERKGRSFGIYKLWKPTEIEDPRLQTDKEIISLFEFCKKNPTWQEFSTTYKEILKKRPEDSTLGVNVTSLYTHSKLTGKFYRIFKNDPQIKVVFKSKDKKNVMYLLDEKTGEKSDWRFSVIRFKFYFPQNPVRVRDLNIIESMKDLLSEIYQLYQDNIIFRTSDTLLGVFSERGYENKILEYAFNKGFFVETYGRYNCNLRALEPAPTPKSASHWKLNLRYKDVQETIDPPICEICQLAPAVKLWPRDYILEKTPLCKKCKKLIFTSSLEEIRNLLCSKDKEKVDEIIEELKEEMVEENLCETCFSIRKEGIKLKKLEKWGKSSKIEKVVWIKIKLDFDLLFKNLHQFYKEYLRTLGIATGSEEIRFSIISEFYEDFNDFLIKFREELFLLFSMDNIETILDDLFCIRIEYLIDILKILKLYHQTLKYFFPKFLMLDKSALKFNIVCANSKFPFFEIWRIITEAEDDVFVSIVRSGTIRIGVKDLETFLQIAKIYPAKSSLFKLSKIAETSKRIAQLTFESSGGDKDSKDYAKLRRVLPFGMDFKSILTLANIVGDG